VRVNYPLSYSGYRIVGKFTADYPMALQIRDLLRYDLFGECVRRVSSIPIDNNYLLTPKAFGRQRSRAATTMSAIGRFERVAELLFG